jgi:hypothetical protein
VTYQEALRVLELERGAEAREVRKAYLRLVKLHSPERDPEGFKRVREAFELANAWSRASEQWIANDEGEALIAPAAPVHVPSSERVELETALATTSDPLVEVRDQLSRLSDPLARARLAREVAVEFGTERAYGLWVEVLGEQAQEAELAEALRAAIAAGYGQYLRVLRSHCPDELDDAELAAWRAEVEDDEGREALTLVRAYLHRGRLVEAAHVLGLQLGAVRRDPLAPRPSALFVLDAVLALFELGAEVEGAQALHALEAAYSSEQRAGLEAQAAHELASLYEQLDSRLVRVMAKALRSGKPEAADAELHQVARLNAKHARAAKGLLKREAPILFAIFGAHLSAEDPDLVKWRRLLRRGTFSLGGGLTFGIWIVLLQSVRYCADRKEHETDAQSVEAPAERVEVLCVHRPALCAHAHAWQRVRDDCSAAEAALEKIDSLVATIQVGEPLNAYEILAVNRIRADTNAVCQRERAGPSSPPGAQ